MTYVRGDIESDGPIPGDDSMVFFSAVIVEPGLEQTLYFQLQSTSDNSIQETFPSADSSAKTA